MRCASHLSLMNAFPGLAWKEREAIRKLCANADQPDDLEALINQEHPKTEQYARSLCHSPWGSRMWRRTLILHAVDKVIGTFGVEALGPEDSDDPRSVPPYEVLNAGDVYSTTLIYNTSADRLFVGCEGDVREAHPEWSESN